MAQVAFDSQMHELKLLTAADEKLRQLRGSVVGTATLAQLSLDSPSSWEGLCWTAEQV